MNTRKTETILLGDPTVRKYILCKYSERENGEVILVRVAEYATDSEAGKEAFELIKDGNRMVVLNELVSAFE